MTARSLRQIACSAAVILALAPAPSAGFVTVDISADLAGAPRWTANEPFGRGLNDGKIAVSISPDFAEHIAMAVTGMALPADVADLEAAVRAAFAAWESPVLRFEVTFDAPTVRSPSLGQEIDVFDVLSSDPEFAASGANFGLASMLWTLQPDRLLTNGTVLGGSAIHGADILIASDRLAAVAGVFTRAQQLRLFQRLMMHEIGHAIGLHHPHDGPAVNFDTDTNPNNAMLVDPANPLATMALSPNRDTFAVMNVIPGAFNALFNASLRNDDRGGRDVLYPALGATQEICQPTPEAGCAASLKSKLLIADDAGDDGKDKLIWKWIKGAATMTSDFGTPDTSTRYSLCLYRGGLPARVTELALPPGPLWKPSRNDSGFKLSDPARGPHGVRAALLKSGVQDKAKIVLKAGKTNLPDGLLPVGTAPIVAQLVRGDTMACWGADFQAAHVAVDDGALFKAKR